jgi:sec-independent protein translocase protein TatB
MIVIFAVALIVVGPDKLPALARSLAKGIMEMKKTLNQVKDNLNQEGEVLDSVQQDLRKTADELRGKMIEADPSAWQLPSTDQAKENEDAAIVAIEPTAIHSPAEVQPTETVPVIENTATAPDTVNQQPPEVLIASQPGAPSPEKNHV